MTETMNPKIVDGQPPKSKRGPTLSIFASEGTNSQKLNTGISAGIGAAKNAKKSGGKSGRIKREPVAQTLLGIHLDELGLKYETEFRFDPDRKWAADFFIPKENILVEIEGGVYSKGRHTRGKGFEDDCIKYNTAQLKYGYTVIRFSTGMVLSGAAKEFLAQHLIF
jgi:very-short-patch-repair endonuclease